MPTRWRHWKNSESTLHIEIAVNKSSKMLSRGWTVRQWDQRYLLARPSRWNPRGQSWCRGPVICRIGPIYSRRRHPWPHRPSLPSGSAHKSGWYCGTLPGCEFWPAFHPPGWTWNKVSKSPANHEPEFARLRMAAVVDVAACLTFAPSLYPPHFLDDGDVSLAIYDGICQLGRGTIPIEGPDVPCAYPYIVFL